MTAIVEKKKKVTNGDLWRAFIIWQFFSHGLYNWERLQGTGFAHTMLPIIRRLYDSKEDVVAALKRHLIFFNTQPVVGAVIHGIVIAMEEERANGADISDEAINGLKTALMGPLAGLGDTLQQALWIPITLALCIGLGAEGNIAGPIIFTILGIAFAWGLAYVMFFGGYRWGSEAIDKILAGGLMERLTTGASIVGLMVAGVMMMRFVTVTTPIVFAAGKTAVKLGPDILDKIVPGLIPLAITLGVWRLLQRKVSANWIVLVVFAVGFVGGWIGWLK